MNKKIFRNILTFLIIFLVINLIFSFFTNKKDGEFKGTEQVELITDEKEYGLTKLVTVKIKNNTGKEVVIPSQCPEEPLIVSQYKNGEWVKKTSKPKIKCEDTKDTVIQSGKTVDVPYTNWNHALFGETGRYKIEASLNIDGQQKTFTSNEFEIKEEGFWRFLWMRGFYQPIYNVLMFFVSVMPGHSLGLAIIVLTIFIRLLLLMPSQKALKSQRRMQELQPKLNEIREKYKGDQQKIAEETMKLWRENKVNPFGSCLPLLIQFPVLIALFYVVQTGLNPDNEYLLYNGFIDVSLSSIDVHFAGILNLIERNVFWLPLVVGLLQFGQMKMTFVKRKTDQKASETEMVNNTMLYFMPVMIAIFTASVPSGVGLYWATSTIFGIAQQYFVNKPKRIENKDGTFLHP